MFRNISLFILLSLLISAASASTINSKPYEPPSLNQGDKYQLVFVTKDKRDAYASDIASYNDFVQAQATLSKLPQDAGTGTGTA